MLEGIAVVGGVVVVVVWVGEEIATRREDIACREIDRRESKVWRTVDLEYCFRLPVQVLTELVAQVGIDIPVANDPDGVIDAYGAMAWLLITDDCLSMKL